MNADIITNTTYPHGTIDASPDRITGLVREAIRQVSRTRS